VKAKKLDQFVPEELLTDTEVCGNVKTDERYGVRFCALLPGHIKHERNFHVANVGPGWLDKDSDQEKK
jgi:hypothetical protein